jgi:hypothetical protein
MSRWSRKSDEEKKAIHDKQTAQEEEAKKDPFSDDAAMDIYRNEEIPIMCLKHGWQASSHYIVSEDTHPLMPDRKILFVSGVCPKCKKPFKRAVPLANISEMMLFTMVWKILSIKNRIEDKRRD